MWPVIFITVAITLVLTLLFLNLRSGEKQIRYAVLHEFSLTDPQFLRSMGQLLGPSILTGNHITALHNGDQIFPAMLSAIRDAEKTITFETYIYWSGEIGQQFSVALCERARAGVKVHVMLDWVGCGRIKEEYLEDMRAAGCRGGALSPDPLAYADSHQQPNSPQASSGGRSSWIHGRCGHCRSVDRPRRFYRTLAGLTLSTRRPCCGANAGGIHRQLIKTRNKVLFGPGYFPELKSLGTSLAQVFKSSRGEGSESVRLMYLLSIASAMRTIRLQAAYFVPDELAIATFISARRRGVKIEIILPGPHTDERIVQSASRHLWPELLDAGIVIYEYEPTMYHCKVFIVDEIWVSVGSTNFDDRSFRLNDEVNLNIYDADFATAQVNVFEQDLTRSRRVTRGELNDRSGAGKFRDRLALTLRRQL
jgi:cardiolipin synthase A/B